MIIFEMIWFETELSSELEMVPCLNAFNWPDSKLTLESAMKHTRQREAVHEGHQW